VSEGERDAADALFPRVYEELRKKAAHLLRYESSDHTLQPTALVHEVYMKLIDQTRVDWKGRTHFFAVGAQAMRRILVDHARAKKREKRGGGRTKVQLEEELTVSPQKDEDVLDLEEALERLETIDPRQATIVELRFFGGMSVAEVAEALGVSKRTIESEWTMIKAWLRRELRNEDESS
jgi:RNA polymerase sigma factor (TIGR02999 family)